MRGSGIFVVARNWDELTRCMVSARIMPRRSSQRMWGNLADAAVATVCGRRRSCLAAHGAPQREASSRAMQVVDGLREAKAHCRFAYAARAFCKRGKLGSASFEVIQKRRRRFAGFLLFIGRKIIRHAGLASFQPALLWFPA